MSSNLVNDVRRIHQQGKFITQVIDEFATDISCLGLSDISSEERSSYIKLQGIKVEIDYLVSNIEKVMKEIEKTSK